MGVTEIDGVNENEEMHITDVSNFYKTTVSIQIEADLLLF